MKGQSFVRRGAVVGACCVLAAHGVAACQNNGVAPPYVNSGEHFGGGAGVADGGGGTTSDTDSGTEPSSGVENLATGIFSPQAIALDPNNVYWTTARGVSGSGTVGDASAGTGSVEAVPRSGGSVTDIVTGLVSPDALAVLDGVLFFSQGATGSGTLDAYTIGATTISPIETGASGDLPLVIDGSTLYWASGSSSSLAVASVATTGGTVSVLANYAHDVSPLAIATAGDGVFVLGTEGSSSVIVSAPSNGETATAIWSEAGVSAVDLALSGDTLYWTVANTPSNGGEVLSMAAVAGGQVVTLATDIDNPGPVAVASNVVYFASDVADGAVLSVSTGGGAVTTLASGLDYPSCLAVADAVYVGTSSTITRVPF